MVAVQEYNDGSSGNDPLEDGLPAQKQTLRTQVVPSLMRMILCFRKQLQPNRGHQYFVCNYLCCAQSTT